MDPMTAQMAVETGVKVFQSLEPEQQGQVIKTLSLGTETENALMLKGGEMTINNANEFLSNFNKAMMDPVKSEAFKIFANNVGEGFKSIASAVSMTPISTFGDTGNMILVGAKNTGGLFSGLFKGIGSMFMTADDSLQQRKIRNLKNEVEREKIKKDLERIKRGEGENSFLGLKFATLVVCILFIAVLIVWVGACYNNYEDYDRSVGTKAVIFIGIMSLILLMAKAGSKKLKF